MQLSEVDRRQAEIRVQTVGEVEERKAELLRQIEELREGIHAND